MTQSLIEIDLFNSEKSSGQLIKQILLKIDSDDQKQITLNLDLSQNNLSCKNMLELLMNIARKDQKKEKRKNISLNALNIGWNKLNTLKFLTPQTAPLFQKIISLMLQSNNLTSLMGLQHINTQSLKDLHLSDNKLPEGELKRILSERDFNELRQLDLNRNQLKNVLFLQENHKMSKLQILCLNGNNISTVDFTQSIFAESLQILFICFNHLQSLPFNLSIFSNLKELYLFNNKIISVQALRFINSNHTLEILNLSQNFITNGKFLAQLNLHNLQSLDLGRNKLVQLNSHSIRRAKLPSIHQFLIYDNLLSGQYFKQLLVGLKQNKLTYAYFGNLTCSSVGKFASHQWIQQNIGWSKSPF